MLPFKIFSTLLCDEFSGTITFQTHSYFVLFFNFSKTKMYQQHRVVYRNLFAYDLALMFIMSILRDLLPCGIVYLVDTAPVWLQPNK